MRVLIALLVLLCGAAMAEERLGDPRLEERARDLFKELRCLVCQNQSLDDSDAPLARDLRGVVRERIAAGDDETAVKRFLKDRYGDFVLLRPPMTTATLALWFGPLFLLLGAGAWLTWKANARIDPPEPLSESEKARLRKLIEDE